MIGSAPPADGSSNVLPSDGRSPVLSDPTCFYLPLAPQSRALVVPATLTDYYLSNARIETPLAEFARAAKAEHRIEECLQRAKSEGGLADYGVRNWIGWHHHQTLSLIATWFLVTELRRGKKMDAGAHGAADSQSPRAAAA